MSFYCKSIFLVAMVLLIVVQKGFAQKTDFNPRKAAMNEFKRNLPVIEYERDGIIDNPTPIYGDINGDGTEDCIISYVAISKDGGNAIIGHYAAIYINIDSSMKWKCDFPAFKFCYNLEYIKEEVIYAKEYECQPPYNTVVRERKFRYSSGKVKLIKLVD